MVLTSLFLDREIETVRDDIDTITTHGAVGDDSTTPTPGDTTLANEVFRSARDDVDKSASGKIIVSLEISSGEANGNSIEEFGWFNDPSAGTMWVRDLLTPITKTSDISLFLDTSITITTEEV